MHDAPPITTGHGGASDRSEPEQTAQHAPTVGIIGFGVIGAALGRALAATVVTRVSDPALGSKSMPVGEVARQSDIVFICVPTPVQGAGFGPIDSSVVEAVLREIDVEVATRSDGGPVVVLRSTVTPDVVARLQADHPTLRLVVCPEFLRQAHADEDMRQMPLLVVGGAPADTAPVVRLFRHHSRIEKRFEVSTGLDAVAAAFLKYEANCFLAMKVTFMNELYDLYRALPTDTPWEVAQGALHKDVARMGATHWRVPGPDGQRGFGGACFPKDLAALIFAARSLDRDPGLLETVWQVNERLRHPSSA